MKDGSYRPTSSAGNGAGLGAIHRLLDRPLTPQDLQEATARVSHPIVPPERQLESLLLFWLRGERFAIPIVGVQRVTLPVAVHRIPHRSNKIIQGLCTIDGELLLCADLASLLEIGAAPSGNSSSPRDAGTRQDEGSTGRMIVLRQADSGPWVTEVDAVDGVLRADPDSYQRPPITVESASGRFTTRLVPLDDGHAALLHVERLLAGFEASLP